MSTRVDMHSLLMRLEDLLGVRFSTRIKNISKNSPARGLMISTDLEEVFPKVLQTLHSIYSIVQAYFGSRKSICQVFLLHCLVLRGNYNQMTNN